MRAATLMRLVLAGSCWLAASCSGAFALDGSGAGWGARDPGSCVPLRQAGPPSAEEAAALFRCRREAAYDASGELWLMEDVDVEVGGARPFMEMYNVIDMPDADTTKPVHPIKGGWTWAVCTTRADAADPDGNCRETDVSAATGACWVTRAGDWRCFMNGRSGETRGPTAPPR